jgi:AraC-like DNA-binding protein
MVVFWVFASALFDDEFRVRGWHVVAWVVVAGVAVINCLAGGASPPVARATGMGLDAAGILFALLAVSRAVVSWKDDLVEGRRRLRLFIVVGGSIYAVLATWSRFGVRPGMAGESSSLFDIAALAVIVVVAAWRMLEVGPRSEIAREAEPRAPELVSARPARVAEEVRPDPVEEASIARLQAEMSVERAYRRENLTIGALAGQLGLQEYRLRRLINQRLGYRNFNAFLNHYRLEAAKQVLADPERADVPVLTVAIDVGFQSIGPFNRAFKAATGLTPTEFRRGGRPTPADPSLQLADSEIG